MVFLGLRQASGFWNTICIRRRKGRMARSSSVVMSVPSMSTLPELGFSRPRIIRPMVDFPLGDGPASPKVSPGMMSKLTSSTATTVSFPSLGGNSLRRLRDADQRVHLRGLPPRGASTSTGRRRQAENTGGGFERQMSVARGTSRRESAAFGQVLRIGDVAGDLQQARRLGPGHRDRVDESLGIGVPRRLEDLLRGAGLDRLARVHDDDPVRHEGDHAEVVGNQPHRHLQLVLELADEAQDLDLGDGVEHRRRLVRDEQVGLPEQAGGQHDPLVHAHADLEGKAPQNRQRLLHAEPLEHGGR